MKVQLVLDAPTFKVGQKVYGNGRLFKGWGTVTEVREAGEGQALRDIYPQVVVKFPDYRGLHYGSRAVIRYNGEDLANGLLLDEAHAPRFAPKPIAVEVDAGCGDPIGDALKGMRDALKALEEAIADL